MPPSDAPQCPKSMYGPGRLSIITLAFTAGISVACWAVAVCLARSVRTSHGELMLAITALTIAATGTTVTAALAARYIQHCAVAEAQRELWRNQQAIMERLNERSGAILTAIDTARWNGYADGLEDATGLASVHSIR